MPESPTQTICFPIAWTGLATFQRPMDAAILRDANGTTWRVSLKSALDQGLFDWPTITPDRRDVVRREATQQACRGSEGRYWLGFFEGVTDDGRKPH